MGSEKILIVDDEKSMRDFFGIMLRKEGYSVSEFKSAEEALGYFRENDCDLVISDIRMQGMDGVELLRNLKEVNPDVPVIMITAYASVDTAIEAMKLGAYDYFTKPFKVDEVKLHIKRAIERSRLYKENKLLKKDLKGRHGFSGLVGSSKKMEVVYKLIMSVAPTKANVLVTGKSGTGKELIARAIHDESPRADKSFIAINCGAIPHNLLESELFGYQKGAFTGAVTNKAGMAEMADGGTLFLDEVTELPSDLQVKLLRFVQERRIRRVGGTTDRAVDIRIVAASNKEIEREVKAGTFRDDLFYRLNVIRIDVPALKERKTDIPSLARHFLSKYTSELGKNINGISEEAMKLLLGYPFPGNVRELENIIERAVNLETGETITALSLPPDIGKFKEAPDEGVRRPPGVEAGVGSLSLIVPEGGMDIERAVEEYEKALIRDALRKADGVKVNAAKLLGLSFRSFRYKLGKYGDL